MSLQASSGAPSKIAYIRSLAHPQFSFPAGASPYSTNSRIRRSRSNGNASSTSSTSSAERQFTPSALTGTSSANAPSRSNSTDSKTFRTALVATGLAELSYLALSRELRRRRLQELVASYEKEKGAITAKELAAIQAEWLE
jgi:hypothetical protein